MGILATRWEATYEGHAIAVSRNELTKGFKLEWDGTEVAHRTWSWIGLGELSASVPLDGHPYRDAAQGRSVELHVTIEMGGLSELDGRCTITVAGQEIPVEHVE